ncbi:MAG: phosphoribosylanthranilate isomerase [Pyrinomonadaceae bacterium]
MIKVKICGITNLEDALVSIKLGAEILGFNFFEKSPRYISPGSAKEIIKKLPAESITVGVFVNESIDSTSRIAQETGIDAIQLHGDETPEFTETVRLWTGLQLIKAFRISNQFIASDVLKYDVDAILLDSYSHAGYGGTGKKFDWEIARQMRDLFPRLYLAGGLKPANVGEAVETVKPYAVDVCSGVEASKGVKDRKKVEAFIRNVREAI